MTHFRAGTLLLMGLILLAGCHRPPPASPGTGDQKQVTVTATPLECPGFALEAKTIVAKQAGNTEPISGGHSITFAPGAVSTDTYFQVSKGSSWDDPASPKYAEIRIVPQSGGSFDFNAPVSIGINYGSCQVNSTQRLRIFQSDDGWRPMGGAVDRGARYVVAYIDHLSEYALAYP